jgi:hypothetical protein
MDLSTTVHLVNNTLFEFKLSAKALKWGYWDTFPLGLLFPKTSSRSLGNNFYSSYHHQF